MIPLRSLATEDWADALEDEELFYHEQRASLTAEEVALFCSKRPPSATVRQLWERYRGNPFGRMLTVFARHNPELEFLHWLDSKGRVETTLKYKELETSVKSLSYCLTHSLKIATRSRVILCFPPGIQFVICFISCVVCGIIPVPVYPPTPARATYEVPRFLRILTTAATTLVITSRNYRYITRYLELKVRDPRWKPIKWICYEDLLDQSEKTVGAFDFPTLSPSDVAFLQFTSGSTSEPKGVMVTHGGLLHNCIIVCASTGLRDFVHKEPLGKVSISQIPDGLVDCKVLNEKVYGRPVRFFSWLPSYHDMGLIGAFCTSLIGGFQLFQLSPVDFIRDPSLWMQGLSDYRCQLTAAPNFALALAVRKTSPVVKGRLDLSCVHRILCGAEAIRLDDVKTFLEFFKPQGLSPFCLMPCYGLAENTLITAGRYLTSQIKPRVIVYDCETLEKERTLKILYEMEGPGYQKQPLPEGTRAAEVFTCGPPVSGVNLRIVHPETKSEVETLVIGEIWVRGDSACRGYFNDPIKTALQTRAQCTFLSGEVSRHEFIRTGDLGTLTSDRELVMLGRLKDLIIVNGRNFVPTDIEWAIEDASSELRRGCVACFAINCGSSEGLAVAAELTDAVAAELTTMRKRLMSVLFSAQDSRAALKDLVQKIRGKVNASFGLALEVVVLLLPRSLPKTSSGKLRRSYIRQQLFLGKLKGLVYQEPQIAGGAKAFAIPPTASAFEDTDDLNNAADKGKLVTPACSIEVAFSPLDSPDTWELYSPTAAYDAGLIKYTELGVVRDVQPERKLFRQASVETKMSSDFASASVRLENGVSVRLEDETPPVLTTSSDSESIDDAPLDLGLPEEVKEKLLGLGKERLTEVIRTTASEVLKDAHLRTLAGRDAPSVKVGDLPQLDCTKPLYELGFDSISAIELVERISELIGHKLDPILVFQFPTIDAVVDSFFAGSSCSSSSRNAAELRLSACPDADQKGRVVGITSLAFRLPSGISDVAALDKALASGTDMVDEIPLDRWNIDAHYGGDRESAIPRSLMYIREGGFVADTLSFDADRFKMSRLEATLLDPQQRSSLSVIFEALRGLGHSIETLPGKRIGVFIGSCCYDWLLAMKTYQAGAADMQFGLPYFERGTDLADTGYAITAASPSILSNRVSYVLGLSGPSLTIDTACSSGLVALDIGRNALLTKQLRTCVVAGASALLMPDITRVLCKGRMLSPSARCHSFSSAADGYIRSEAYVALTLSLVPDPRGGQRGSEGAGSTAPLAYVYGTSTNHGGKAVSLTAPNSAAHRRVISDAMRAAKVSPADVHYVEAHGTGTVLGDPIEVAGLKLVFGEKYGGSRENPLVLGAAKSYAGHAEGAAGLVGLIVALMVSKNEKAYGIRDLWSVNERLDLSDFAVKLPLHCQTVDLQSREQPSEKRYPAFCGVSAFGYGGTNAHVILTAAAEGGLQTLQKKSTVEECTLERAVISGRLWKGLLGRQVLVGDGNCAFRGFVSAWGLRRDVARLMSGCGVGHPLTLQSSLLLEFLSVSIANQSSMSIKASRQSQRYDGGSASEMRQLVGVESVSFESPPTLPSDCMRSSSACHFLVLVCTPDKCLTVYLTKSSSEADDLVSYAEEVVAAYRSAVKPPDAPPAGARKLAQARLMRAGLRAEQLRYAVPQHSMLVPDDGDPDRNYGASFWKTFLENQPEVTHRVDALTLYRWLENGGFIWDRRFRAVRDLSFYDCGAKKTAIANLFLELETLTEQAFVVHPGFWEGLMQSIRAIAAIATQSSRPWTVETFGSVFPALHAEGAEKPWKLPAYSMSLCAYIELQLTPGRTTGVANAWVVDGVTHELVLRLDQIRVLRQDVENGTPVCQRREHFILKTRKLKRCQFLERRSLGSGAGLGSIAPSPECSFAEAENLGSEVDILFVCDSDDSTLLQSLQCAYRKISPEEFEEVAAGNRVSLSLKRCRCLVYESCVLQVRMEQQSREDAERAAPLLKFLASLKESLMCVREVISLTTVYFLLPTVVADSATEEVDLCPSFVGPILDCLAKESREDLEHPLHNVALFLVQIDERAILPNGSCNAEAAEVLTSLIQKRARADADSVQGSGYRQLAYVDGIGLMKSSIENVRCVQLRTEGASAVDVLGRSPANMLRLHLHRRFGRVLQSGAHQLSTVEATITAVSPAVTKVELGASVLSLMVNGDTYVEVSPLLTVPLCGEHLTDSCECRLASQFLCLVSLGLCFLDSVQLLTRTSSSEQLSGNAFTICLSAGYEALIPDTSTLTSLVNVLQEVCRSEGLKVKISDPNLRDGLRLMVKKGDFERTSWPKRRLGGAPLCDEAPWSSLSTFDIVAEVLRINYGVDSCRGAPLLLQKIQQFMITELAKHNVSCRGVCTRHVIVDTCDAGLKVVRMPSNGTRLEEAYVIAQADTNEVCLALGALLLEDGAACLIFIADHGSLNCGHPKSNERTGWLGRIRVLLSSENPYTCEEDIRQYRLLGRRVFVLPRREKNELPELLNKLELQYSLRIAALIDFPTTTAEESPGALVERELAVIGRERASTTEAFLGWATSTPHRYDQLRFVLIIAHGDSSGAQNVMEAAIMAHLQRLIYTVHEQGFAKIRMLCFEKSGGLERTPDNEIVLAAIETAIRDTTMAELPELPPCLWAVRPTHQDSANSSLHVELGAATLGPSSPNKHNFLRMSTDRIRAVVSEELHSILRDVLTTQQHARLPKDLAETRLTSLGLDSLAAVETISRLNILLGMKLPLSTIFKFPTLGQLVTFLTDAAINLHSEQACRDLDIKNAVARAAANLPLQRNELAILGMSCWLPGKSTSLSEYWDTLIRGTDCIVEVPVSRMNIDAFYSTNQGDPECTYVRESAAVTDVERFEPATYGVDVATASGMSPQQRLMLQVARQAIVNAHINTNCLISAPVGVFVGISGTDSFGLETSNTGDVSVTALISSRISYCLGLSGPCCAMDTACSSSLVAVDVACAQMLHNPCNCQAAVVGGVSVHTSASGFVLHSRSRMLSPVCRCRPFEANADGYVRGEGAAAVVLVSEGFRESLQAKHNSQLPVLGYVVGTSTNHSGRTGAVHAPSLVALEACVRSALFKADLTPAAMSLIECHGAGTTYGDATEAKALCSVFGSWFPAGEQQRSLYLGAGKSNIGHLEGAAGAAAFLKLVLSMHKREVPPILHLESVNPATNLNLKSTSVKLVSSKSAALPSQEELFGGVTASGLGGSNAHVCVRVPLMEQQMQNVIEADFCLGSQFLPWKLPEHPLLGRYEADSDTMIGALRKDLQEFMKATDKDMEATDKENRMLHYETHNWCKWAALLLSAFPAILQREKRQIHKPASLASDSNSISRSYPEAVEIMNVRFGKAIEELVFADAVVAKAEKLASVTGGATMAYLAAESRQAAIAVVVAKAAETQVPLTACTALLSEQRTGLRALEQAALGFRGFTGPRDNFDLEGNLQANLKLALPEACKLTVTPDGCFSFRLPWSITTRGLPTNSVRRGLGYNTLSFAEVIGALPYVFGHAEPLKLTWIKKAYLRAYRLSDYSSLGPQCEAEDTLVKVGDICLSEKGALILSVAFYEDFGDRDELVLLFEELTMEIAGVSAQLRSKELLTDSAEEADEKSAVLETRNAPSVGYSQRPLLDWVIAFFARRVAEETGNCQSVGTVQAEFTADTRLSELASDAETFAELTAKATEQLGIPCDAEQLQRARTLHDLEQYFARLVAESSYEVVNRNFTGGKENLARQGGAVLYLFSGQGASYEEELNALCDANGKMRSRLIALMENAETTLKAIVPKVLEATGLGRQDSEGETKDIPDEQKSVALRHARYFVAQVILAELLREYGLQPTVTLGHSLGEYAAAVVSGRTSLESALNLLLTRAVCLALCPCAEEDADMIACRVTRRTLQAAIDATGVANVVVGVENGDRSCVLSGSVQGMKSVLEQAGVTDTSRRALNLGFAYHSPLLEPAATLFRKVTQLAEFQAPSAIDRLSQKVKWIPSIRPQHHELACLDAAYCAEHLVQPVEFVEAMEVLLRETGTPSLVVEVPGHHLTQLLKAHLSSTDVPGTADVKWICDVMRLARCSSEKPRVENQLQEALSSWAETVDTQQPWREEGDFLMPLSTVSLLTESRTALTGEYPGKPKIVILTAHGRIPMLGLEDEWSLERFWKGLRQTTKINPLFRSRSKDQNKFALQVKINCPSLSVDIADNEDVNTILMLESVEQVLLSQCAYLQRNGVFNRAKPEEVSLEKYLGGPVGNFVGYSSNSEWVTTYLTSKTKNFTETSGNDLIQKLVEQTSASELLGLAGCMAANRVSYELQLTGPSLNVDTGCSSFPAALCAATDALRAGRCKYAVVSAAWVHTMRTTFTIFSKMGFLTNHPKREVRSFDCEADGTFLGEACGSFLLSSSDDAPFSRENALGVVRAAATMTGSPNSSRIICAPSQDSILTCMREALIRADASVDDILHVEGHGTGIVFTDVTEWMAIDELCATRRSPNPVYLTSVHPYLGHANAALGVTQMMRTIAAHRFGEIVKQISFAEPHKALSEARIKVPTEHQKVPEQIPFHHRLTCINTLGMGSVNGCIVIEGAPPSVILPSSACYSMKTIEVVKVCDRLQPDD